ncbi:hypothetical protein LTR62_000939 [Meristemomyces frigidus]|uniref:Uncharacterized protein n=1 Tax=Meristemomyces frigidus TaxID=1508187 RepID=A0AAN7TH97_9PEZI|nr:hypothetical protein LTR62_000939 [Meristemomyces frigidus]
MADLPPDARPWSNDEKNYLLAEMIKQQSPPPTVLYTVVANNVQALRWDDLPLPYGRSLNSCRAIFDQLQRTLPQHVPFMTNPYGPHTPLSAPPIGIKRSFPQLESAFPGREIRPKPHPASTLGMSQPGTSEPPTKRKRGRPTKKEAEEKAAKAQGVAVGESGPSSLRIATAPPGSSNIATPVTTVGLPVDAPRPALAPTTRMPISAMLTPTAPHTASSSSSSSGKRRRGRSTRSDPEGRGEFGTGEQHYESPYARAPTSLEDTPARAAVMRHREEQQTPIHPPAISSAELGSGEASGGTSGVV